MLHWMAVLYLRSSSFSKLLLLVTEDIYNTKPDSTCSDIVAHSAVSEVLGESILRVVLTVPTGKTHSYQPARKVKLHFYIYLYGCLTLTNLFCRLLIFCSQPSLSHWNLNLQLGRPLSECVHI